MVNVKLDQMKKKKPIKNNLNILVLNQQKNNLYLKKLIKILNKKKGDKIFILKNNKPKIKFIGRNKINLLISFHNGHLVKNKIIKELNYNCINFHPSYLPMNRGAFPILWGAAINNKFGVTIHKMIEKIDGGDYLFQKKIFFKKDVTLKKAYHKHELESLNGFKKIYKIIRKQILTKNFISLKIKRNQKIKSNFFYVKESKKLISKLPNKWETKLSEVKRIYSFFN